MKKWCLCLTAFCVVVFVTQLSSVYGNSVPHPADPAPTEPDVHPKDDQSKEVHSENPEDTNVDHAEDQSEETDDQKVDNPAPAEDSPPGVTPQAPHHGAEDSEQHVDEVGKEPDTKDDTKEQVDHQSEEDKEEEAPSAVVPALPQDEEEQNEKSNEDKSNEPSEPDEPKKSDSKESDAEQVEQVDKEPPKIESPETKEDSNEKENKEEEAQEKSQEIHHEDNPEPKEPTSKNAESDDEDTALKDKRQLNIPTPPATEANSEDEEKPDNPPLEVEHNVPALEAKDHSDEDNQNKDGHEEDSTGKTDGKDHGSDAAHWSYEGIYGPSNWSHFDQRCSPSSPRQSPINIVQGQSVFDPDLDRISLAVAVNETKDEVRARNNGHSVNFKFMNTIRVLGGALGDSFRVAGVHFHWGEDDFEGSEHMIDGYHFPLEMHIVTYNDERYDELMEAVNGDDSLAVFGVPFQISEEDNPSMEEVVAALANLTHPGDLVPVNHFDLAKLLPDNTAEYYRYPGSLTTPPCAESVVWTVFRHTVPISESQLDKFRQLLQEPDNEGEQENIEFNWRPVQDIQQRIVRRSFEPPSSDEEKLPYEKAAISKKVPVNENVHPEHIPLNKPKDPAAVGGNKSPTIQSYPILIQTFALATVLFVSLLNKVVS